MIQDILFSTRISIITATLLYTSYLDWRYREIDDRIWIISGTLLTILTVLDLTMDWSIDKLFLSLLSIGFSSGLAFAFYFFGLYGGADAKAISVISLGMPIYYSPRGLHPFTGLASLTNGLIFSLTLPLILLAYNIIQMIKGRKIFEGFEHESIIKRIFAVLFGVRLRNAKSRKFWFMMEEEVEGIRRFKFNLFSLELSEIDRDDVWVTPGIPLLIFITAGFLYYIFIGDISHSIIKSILALLNIRIIP
ncbi:MAG: prepilin peptidase [Nitrososphaeria archaeon]|nr:prepilin peptidase [Nitrososphaeria archaeon]